MTIVLPLCWIVMAALLTIGQIMGRQALLDAAADRAVILVRMAYADPNYLGIAGFDTAESEQALESAGEEALDPLGIDQRRPLGGRLDRDPYRYLNRSAETSITKAAEHRVRAILNAGNQLPGGVTPADPQIDISVIQGILGIHVRVAVKQYLTLPLIPTALFPDFGYRMQADSEAAVSCTPEMIRNTDYALDLAERYTGIDLQEKLNGILGKAAAFLPADPAG